MQREKKLEKAIEAYPRNITLMVSDTEKFCLEDGKHIYLYLFPSFLNFLNVMSHIFVISNNLDDVRNEWERIKLAYEILSDRKLRIRYDRHEALNDPAAAVGRMAVNALGWGAMGIAKGIFNVGGLALKTAADGLAESQKDEEVSNNTISSKAAESRMKSTLKSPPLLTGDVLMFQGFEFQDELPMVNSNGAVAFDARMQMDAELGLTQIMKRTFLSFVNALEDLLSIGNSLATRFFARFFKRRVNKMV